jgi:hypothetical protein
VNIHISHRVFDVITIERDEFAFKIEVLYERMPQFSSHCYVIGQTISCCKWLNNHSNDVTDRDKKIINIKNETNKDSLQYVVKKKKCYPKIVLQIQLRLPCQLSENIMTRLLHINWTRQ